MLTALSPLDYSRREILFLINLGAGCKTHPLNLHGSCAGVILRLVEALNRRHRAAAGMKELTITN